MSTLGEGVLQVLAGALSGGGVGAIASLLAAKIKSRADARRTDARLAHAVMEAELERQRALWARVETLERRCDERDAHIDQLEAHARRCEESLLESQRLASECEARYARLQAELAEMKTRFDATGGES